MLPDEKIMHVEIDGLSSVSDRIRALDRAGYKRADIARFLGKSYQHVRNVLVGDEQVGRRKPLLNSVERADAKADLRPTSGSERVKIGLSGQVDLPPRMREALGLKEGDVLFARLAGGEIHLLTPNAAMQRAQAIIRQFVPEGVSLVDELLDDRRQEVEREERGG